MENWRDIPGFEGRYQVSDLGRVRSLDHYVRFATRAGKECWRMKASKIMSQQMQNSGYMIVHLNKDYAHKALTVHRLVATAFVENPAGLHEVNHEDTNKTNNKATNLEWMTSVENHVHAVHQGLNKQATKVRIRGVEFPSMAMAARALKTSIGTITRSAYRGVPDSRGNQWELA